MSKAKKSTAWRRSDGKWLIVKLGLKESDTKKYKFVSDINKASCIAFLSGSVVGKLRITPVTVTVQTFKEVHIAEGV